jgi:hypothetical protein
MDDEQKTDVIEVSQRSRRRIRPLALAGIAVVAVGAGAGIAYAATNHSPASATTSAYSTTTSPSPAASAAPGRHWRGRGFRIRLGGVGLGMRFGSIEHGQVTVRKNGADETIDIQHGTVSAVSSTSITVKSTDGFTDTYAVSSDTIVDAESAGIGSVKTGDNVYVSATTSGSTLTAIGVIDTTAVKDGRAHFTTPSAQSTLPVS